MALFIIYCIDGELDNIKKISLKNCDLECGFRWACRNGHCDIIQYLVNLYKTDINGNINTYDPIYIHAFGELGFTWACMNGHYDIVQYLVNLYKTDNTYKPININNNGFRWACDKGHYNIVRYLIELYKIDPIYKPIDIHVENEEGFRWANENGHHNIVKYLMNLYKKHDYKPIKNYLMVFEKIDKYLL